MSDTRGETLTLAEEIRWCREADEALAELPAGVWLSGAVEELNAVAATRDRAAFRRALDGLLARALLAAGASRA